MQKKIIFSTPFASSFCFQRLDWRKPCVFKSLESTWELRMCNKDCLRPTDQINPGTSCHKSDFLGGSVWLQVPAVTAMCWNVSNPLTLTHFPGALPTGHWSSGHPAKLLLIVRTITAESCCLKDEWKNRSQGQDFACQRKRWEVHFPSPL